MPAQISGRNPYASPSAQGLRNNAPGQANSSDLSVAAAFVMICYNCDKDMPNVPRRNSLHLLSGRNLAGFRSDPTGLTQCTMRS